MPKSKSNIYTGYYGAVKSYPDDAVIIGVSGKVPEGINKRIKPLAPKYSWWKEWHDTFADNLNSQESKDWYKQRYRDSVLSTLSADEVVSEIQSAYGTEKPVILCCFEKPDCFCHRQLIAEWLSENGYECTEFPKV